MSDTATQADPAETGNEDPNLRLLREKAKRADEADAALKALQRENAMLKSNIDTDSPLGKFFVDSYDGDPSDIEGLTAKAKELGVPFRGSQETPEEAEKTPEPTGTTERQALADGAPADTGENEDPNLTAKKHFDRRMAEGAPRDVAAGEALNMIANAAAQGDPRVIVP